MHQTLDSGPVQIVLVTAAHGLDASQYTFNYVAGWAHDAATPDGPSVEDLVKATGQRVIGAADKILQATKPAPTLVDDALAELAVQVSHRVDAAMAPPTTPVAQEALAVAHSGVDRRAAASVDGSSWEVASAQPQLPLAPDGRRFTRPPIRIGVA